ncbi:MAG: hypothetical protein J6L58_03205, partial [Clostridia bacterium]|nr:hypothetical protein [Clostridia bacterium]
SIFLAALMLVMVPLSVSAETTVQPRYTYTAMHSTTLIINDDVAIVESFVDGYSTVTSIKMTLTLQKKVLWWWDDVTEWSDIAPRDSLTMSESTTIGSGTYRAKLVAVVCSGTESETIEGYSSEKTN